MDLEVPPLVRQRAMANGEPGRRWLATLPDVVAELAERWELELGPSFAGGTASFVAAATRPAGEACVLKVAMPLEIDDAETFSRSVLVHELAAGRGCAELYDHDPAVPAMLVERLGPNVHELDLPLPAVLDAIAATLNAFWQPAPSTGLWTGAEKAAWLADYIETGWVELGRPCPRAVVDRALAHCADRAAAFDPATAVVVHGDAHGWNTLAAGSGRYKFVDPEGVAGEPAQDLAVPMREYNEPLLEGDTARLVRERAERLGTACDVDPVAIWQWGFIERVSTGFANLRDFESGAGEGFLEVAERCL